MSTIISQTNDDEIEPLAMLLVSDERLHQQRGPVVSALVWVRAAFQEGLRRIRVAEQNARHHRFIGFRASG